MLRVPMHIYDVPWTQSSGRDNINECVVPLAVIINDGHTYLQAIADDEWDNIDKCLIIYFVEKI